MNLKEKSVLIAGVVRDCANDIRSELDNLKAAFSCFASVQILLIESDSSDDTVAILSQLSENWPELKFESLGKLADKIESRTARIAHCRNRYLDKIASDSAYSDLDYIAIADMDGANPKIDIQSVESCFLRDDWAVCAANQKGPYYDVWALRHPLWSPNDCWRQYHYMVDRMGVNWQKARKSAVISRMIEVPVDAEWIEVDSAFGGLAIYHRSAIEGARYNGLHEDGTEVCEHVAFHQQIKSVGHKLFINPRFINSHSTMEHKRLSMKWWLSEQMKTLKLK